MYPHNYKPPAASGIVAITKGKATFDDAPTMRETYEQVCKWTGRKDMSLRYFYSELDKVNGGPVRIELDPKDGRSKRVLENTHPPAWKDLVEPHLKKFMRGLYNGNPWFMPVKLDNWEPASPEDIDCAAVVNAEEFVNAWKHNRDVNRTRIMKALGSAPK